MLIDKSQQYFSAVIVGAKPIAGCLDRAPFAPPMAQPRGLHLLIQLVSYSSSSKFPSTATLGLPAGSMHLCSSM
jgi:hypothetical protein